MELCLASSSAIAALNASLILSNVRVEFVLRVYLENSRAERKGGPISASAQDSVRTVFGPWFGLSATVTTATIHSHSMRGRNYGYHRATCGCYSTVCPVASRIMIVV